MVVGVDVELVVGVEVDVDVGVVVLDDVKLVVLVVVFDVVGLVLTVVLSDVVGVVISQPAKLPSATDRVASFNIDATSPQLPPALSVIFTNPAALHSNNELPPPRLYARSARWIG